MKNAKVGAITRDKLDVWNMVSGLLCEDDLNRAVASAQDDYLTRRDRGIDSDGQLIGKARWRGVTPTNSMPVKRRVYSGVAKETLRALIFLRSRLLTSMRVVARTTQAMSFCFPVLIVTKMQFAETSIA